MVLGMRNKKGRGPSIQVEYVIHVQDIKPWPPTQSLKTVRSVLIQWENGERNSGSTSAVTPLLDDGKIEFNESFRLPVTLSRDMSVKNGDIDIFHKNLLEFNLYEPRRDKTVKGQLLGTAIVDLADYGILKDVTSVTAPMNCTRSFRNTTQPILHLRIQSYDRARSGSSLRGRLAKEGSLDKNEGESVSVLMSEEYADEADVASLTDDDMSSHSSVTALSAPESNGASPSLIKENGSGREPCENVKDHMHSSKQSQDNVPALHVTAGFASVSKSGYVFASDIESSLSRQVHGSGQQIKEQINPVDFSDKNWPMGSTIVVPLNRLEKPISEDYSEDRANGDSESSVVMPYRTHSTGAEDRCEINEVALKDGGKHEQNGNTEKHFVGDAAPGRLSPDVDPNQLLCGSDSSLIKDRHRLVKSVRSPMDSFRNNGSGGGLSGGTVKQEAKMHVVAKQSSFDITTKELKQRIDVLETELREAAAMEVALYSIVAEHGSSVNKVHAPARRLSRIYLQAGSKMKRASAARSAVSGLVLVAKACGNDVPRLTFWLSNCVVLRAIVSETFVEEPLPVSAGPLFEGNGTGNGLNRQSSTLNWKVSSSEKQTSRSVVPRNCLDMENQNAFVSALEKVESWIFSRIVESVWWQTLTPHMQSSATEMIDKAVGSSFKKNNRRTSFSTGEEQVNLSLEIWKRAFKDACERLCPVRSGGHECGCLPVLAKLIMEQCVARLDVAMFNAILRESADDIPTDPVSDPIGEAKVLPIPAGKSSFGAGALLKNAIGNWSRWLGDLFGIDDDDDDDDDVPEVERGGDFDEGYETSSSSKCFHLLKSLSDLMMLPKDMLLRERIRREVCPSFGAPLIRRVLENFVPDEFCPDPIPETVFEALNSEENDAEGEGLITSIPCRAPAVFYSPPSASSLAIVMGGVTESHLRRSTSILRMSNTSDDELDELDSPLNSILGDPPVDSHQASPTRMRLSLKLEQNRQNNVLRYQLLREVWDKNVEL